MLACRPSRFFSATVSTGAVLFLLLFLVEDPRAGEKPKASVAEIMKRAMASGLCKKCTNGRAGESEKQKLLELFINLASHPCPKGDPTSWKQKTQALVSAAKSLAKNEAGAEKKLDAAVDCRGCHLEHKK